MKKDHKVKLFKSQLDAINYLLKLKSDGIDSNRLSYIISGGYHRIYIFNLPIFKK